MLPLPVTAKRQVVIIPKDRPEEEIDGHRGKYFEKRKLLRRGWKTPREMLTTGPESKRGDEKETGDNDVPE